jgi:biofilm PGA synthesis protein PgaD
MSAAREPELTLAPAAAADSTAAPADPTADDILAPFERQLRTPLVIEPEPPDLSARSMTRHLITLGLWSAWVHLLMPLLTLVAWMTGWRRLTTQLLAPEGLGLLIRYLPTYLTVLGIMCGSLIAWALFNWWRFSDRERRTSCPAVTLEQVASTLDLPSEELARWRSQRRLVMYHDDQGRPSGLHDPTMP